MAYGRQLRIGIALKQIARSVLGAFSPRLLRQVQVSRARARYRREPALGPRRLLLEVSTACNYHCLMCTDHGPLMPTSTPAKVMPWDRLEPLLRDAAAMGAEQAWFAGRGEPLLHPQALEMIALASSLKLRTAVTTNGSKLDESFADSLCEAGLTQLSISLNAGSAATYSEIHGAPASEYARLLSVIRRISSRPNPPLLCASMVVLQPNAHEVAAFVQEAIAAGVHAINLLGLRYAERFATLAQEETEELRRDLEMACTLARRAGIGMELHNLPQGRGQKEALEPLHWRLGCYVGHQFVRVDVDGNLEGCCSCANHLGRLTDSSFAEAWRSSAYQEFREQCRRMPETKAAPPGCNCADCGNVMDNNVAYREMGLIP